MSIDVNCTAWKGFRTGEWRHLVNVRNFIQKNYTPYQGGDDFLAPISPKTAKVWEKAEALILEEIKKGIIDVETHAVSGIDNFAPGYIDKDNEVVVGLQTDAPSSASSTPSAASETPSPPWSNTAISWTRRLSATSASTERPTTRASLTPIPSAPGTPATPVCSPACPTPMAAAALWATTAASLCTAPTSLLKRSRRIWTCWTAP